MREYINETNEIVTELLKLIPSSFLMSEKFKSACQEQGYSYRWNTYSTIIGTRGENMFASYKEKTELTLEKVCHDLCKDCVNADGETDYSNIGNSCRHLLIQLAQSVYDPGLHGEFTDEGLKIGKAHIVEMLSKYFSHCLSGKNNEEYRAYTNATLKLANMLIHKIHPTKKDMKLTASATINLIYIVGIIGNKFNQM